MADEALITFEHVSKGFGTGGKRVEPLKDISLEIRRGETVAIIGPSGTGKSVTLRLMLRLLDPDDGRVLFEGKDMADFDEVTLDAMRRRMSMLFQSGALFDSMTVGENVAFGLRARGETDEGRIDAVVREKLRQVGLPDTEEKMPSQLSGGMRKRAALARSIAMNPEVILYDEPTTGLDPIMSDAIGDLVNDTREAMKDVNVTSIVVTHDMNVAFKTADRVIMLHQGHVVGEGTPEWFRKLGHEPLPPDAGERERMVRQFVRGEAEGPIRAVV